MSRLQNYYKETVVPQLKDKFSYENIMEVPKVTKITLNMGVGEAVGDKKVMDRAVGDMTAIAGQKPIVKNARKSVARAGPSAARSRCGVSACMSSWTGW
jgi:large subunit ribosomal protein L5